MSHSKQIRPPILPSNSQIGYVKIISSNPESRLLRLFQNDRDALNQFIDTWRQGQLFDLTTHPQNSYRSAHRSTPYSSQSNLHSHETSLSSSEYEAMEVFIKQRAKEILLMSKTPQGRVDHTSFSNEDDTESKQEEVMLKSFLDVCGPRISIICADCHDAMELNANHRCTPSETSKPYKKPKDIHTSTPHEKVKDICAFKDYAGCFGNLGYKNLQAAFEYSIPIPFDWSTLRDKLMTPEASQYLEGFKTRKDPSTSSQEKSRQSSKAKKHRVKTQYDINASSTTSKPSNEQDKGCTKGEAEDSNSRPPMQGTSCEKLTSQCSDLKSSNQQSRTDSDEFPVQNYDNVGRLLQRQQLKRKKQERKMRVKERKMTEKHHEVLEEQQKLERQEAQQMQAVHEQEKLLRHKVKREACRRSFMDQADQVYRSYLFDCVKNCHVDKVGELLRMKPLPSQEKLQDPPVPATSAAQNLDLWEHYERTPRDNNIISVYSGIQETLLHVAVKTGSLRMTELLLSHGPSLVSVDSAGRTPLHTASEPSNFKSIDIIKLLIEHGPIHYIDTQTIQSQDTCLHIAAAAQNSALVQYLLEMHVKTHFVNADGHTAEQVARMRLQRVEQKRKAHNQNSSGISQDSFECSRKIVAHFTQARELMQKNMAQKEQLENEKRLKEAIKMELENQEDDKIRRKQEEKLMKEAKKREEEEELLRNLVKSTNSGKRKKNKSKNKSKAITASSSNTVHQENIQVGEQRSSSAHINPEDSANEPTKGSEVIHDKSNVPYDNDNSSHDVGYQSIPVEPFSYQQFIGIHQRIMELHNQSLPTQRTFYQLSSSDQAIPTPTPRPTRAVQHTQRRFSQPMQLQGTQTNQRHAPASGVSPQQNIVMLPTTVNATSTSFSPHRSKMNFSQTTLDNSKVISPPRTTQHLAASSSYVSNESVFTWNAFSPEIWGPPQPQVALVRNIPQQSFATNPVAFDVHTNLPRFSLFD